MNRIHTDKKYSVRRDLKTKGFSLLASSEISLSQDLNISLKCLASTYDDSPGDGPNRRRFYSRYVLGPYTTVDTLDLRPHSNSFMSSDYQQPGDINPEQKGVLRSYAPLPASVWSNLLLKELIFFDLNLLPLEDFWLNSRRNPLLVGIHLIRMVARPEMPGVPTPSLPHQDGEPFTFVHLINRCDISGGESQVFRNTPIDGISAPGQLLVQTTLDEALDSLIIWDRKIFHHVTPINVTTDSAEGTRDVLIIDFSPLEECRFNSRGEIAIDSQKFCMNLNFKD